MNGSGGERASLYWRQHYKPGNNSREEILNLMKRTLSYVSLFDEMSGGIMRVVEMKPLGYNEEYNQQVLQVLFDHYDHLGNDLSSSLFTLWNNTDGAYVHELNIKVHESFIEEFEGYKQSVVIRKNKKFIIRLLHFEEDCHVDLALRKVENNHQFWVQLNRQPEHLVDVPPVIRALPWACMDILSLSPVVYGKVTRELADVLFRLVGETTPLIHLIWLRSLSFYQVF